MKLHRHYKNKPYKYIGIAKHSETLEDLVIYECLYDNPSAKIWVRPKEMFSENVEMEGKTVPRFASVPLRIETFTEVSEELMATLAPLVEKTLGKWEPERFHAKLRGRARWHLTLAYVDGQAAGFKLGYEEDQWCFYSWLGAVLPEYRGLGIASALMKSQHDWCREQGYRKVRTKTQNRFKEMLILNINAGFDVIGTHASDDGGIKILMEKKL